MNQQEYRIPESLPLPLSVLFKAKGSSQQHYPFCSHRNQYYYLARNAIWHGIDSLGLIPGDVVLVPAFHHGVEVETLLRKGLSLAYYRIDEHMCIDFDHLERLINGDVKAIYVIHYIGFPQPVNQLVNLAKKYDLPLIEDCALSLFSESPEGPLGTSGDISVFCLYKSLPVPHGGVLALNNPALSLPAVPRSPDLISTSAILANRLLDNLDMRWARYGHRFTGILKSTARRFKKKMSVQNVPVNTEKLVEKHLELGASSIIRFLIDRMSKESIVGRRRSNYARLATSLNGYADTPFPTLDDGVCPLFFPIMVDDKVATHTELRSRGIESVNFWSQRHEDVPAGQFPEVDYLRDHVLELPIHQGLDEKHIDCLASIVKEIL